MDEYDLRFQLVKEQVRFCEQNASDLLAILQSIDSDSIEIEKAKQLSKALRELIGNTRLQM